MENQPQRIQNQDLITDTLFFLEVGGTRFGLSGPVRGDVTREERAAGKESELVQGEPMTLSFGLLPAQSELAQSIVGQDGQVFDRSGHVVMTLHVEQVSPKLNVLVGIARPSSTGVATAGL